MKKKILIYQKNLRKPITEFGKFFRYSQYVFLGKSISDKETYKNIPSFKDEMQRTKDGVIPFIRRIIGIPNIWIPRLPDGDVVFTSNYFLITSKSYCMYVENGLAPYGYDRKIADNPIAVYLVSFFLKKKNLRKIIFMSQMAQKSFLSSVDYSETTKRLIKEKSAYCYPTIEVDGADKPKRANNQISFLFSGLFYMKGGVELINAFEKITKKYHNAQLTIITPLQAVSQKDQERIASISTITLFDAQFSPKEMAELYKKHDIFVLPTFRDSLGVVLLEALAFGMPLIITDQYATSEFISAEKNGFIYPNHPMKDYNPETGKLLGRFYNPKDFYKTLFKLKEEGGTNDVERFIFSSMEAFILHPELIEEYSKNSLNHYRNQFQYQTCTDRMESLLLGDKK